MYIREAIRKTLRFFLHDRADKIFFRKDDDTGFSSFTRFGHWVYLGSAK